MVKFMKIIATVFIYLVSMFSVAQAQLRQNNDKFKSCSTYADVYSRDSIVRVFETSDILREKLSSTNDSDKIIEMLSVAIDCKQVDSIKTIISFVKSKHIDLNKGRRYVPLVEAIIEFDGDFQILDLLLDAGSSPFVLGQTDNESLSTSGDSILYIKSPLLVALFHDKWQSLFNYFFNKYTSERILNTPVDVEGNTLMHLVALSKNDEKVKYFFEKNGSLENKNQLGETPYFAFLRGLWCEKEFLSFQNARRYFKYDRNRNFKREFPPDISQVKSIHTVLFNNSSHSAKTKTLVGATTLHYLSRFYNYDLPLFYSENKNRNDEDGVRARSEKAYQDSLFIFWRELVQIYSTQVNSLDKDGNTPLIYFSAAQIPEASIESIVRKQLKGKRTSGMYTTENQIRPIQTLLALNPSLDALNKVKMTALFYAGTSGLEDTAVELLKAGANANIGWLNGRTLREYLNERVRLAYTRTVKQRYESFLNSMDLYGKHSYHVKVEIPKALCSNLESELTYEFFISENINSMSRSCLILQASAKSHLNLLKDELDKLYSRALGHSPALPYRSSYNHPACIDNILNAFDRMTTACSGESRESYMKTSTSVVNEIKRYSELLR